MSSSRSVAAARQRRAGTADAPPPSQRGPATSISSSQVFTQSKTKTLEEPPMSINKAITLTTLRLSRLETIVQHMNDINQSQDQDPNVKIIGDDVINMIMSRLDTIEKNQMQQSVSNFQEQLQDIETRIEESADIIMNLQTFTMDTNQSLVKKQITDCVEKSKLAIEMKISKSNLSILKLQATVMDLTQKLSMFELSEKSEPTQTIDEARLVETLDEPILIEPILVDTKDTITDVEINDNIGKINETKVESVETILSKEDLDSINYIV